MKTAVTLSARPDPVGDEALAAAALPALGQQPEEEELFEDEQEDEEYDDEDDEDDEEYEDDEEEEEEQSEDDPEDDMTEDEKSAQAAAIRITGGLHDGKCPNENGCRFGHKHCCAACSDSVLFGGGTKCHASCVLVKDDGTPCNDYWEERVEEDEWL